MWGVLLVPSSSPTLLPIYDGLDVHVTSDLLSRGFTSTNDMVSRRIYKLSFYGGHSITVSYWLTFCKWSHGRIPH